MNNQDALNKACEFLMKQGCASMNETGDCVYIQEDGRRCAVGALLTADAAQQLTFKNWDVLGALEFPDVAKQLKGCDASFLQALQEAHDATRFGFVTSFRSNVYQLAEDYNLDVPECVRKQ